MRKTAGLLAAVVVLAISALTAWGAAGKETGAQKQPRTQSAPGPAVQVAPIVRGHVTYTVGSGVPGIEVSLYRTSGRGERARDTLVATRTSDSRGAYAFGLSPDEIGKAYEVIAKYKEFPKGQYFTPERKTFVVAAGVNTINFVFDPPPLRVSGTVRASANRAFPKLEVCLYVVGASQRNLISCTKTDKFGDYRFEVPPVNVGRDFVVKPNDPIYQLFNPIEKAFKLDGNTVADFMYAGPFPDLKVSISSTTSGDIPTKTYVITNQGNAFAGQSIFSFAYMVNTPEHVATLADSQEKELTVPQLAPGASWETSVSAGHGCSIVTIYYGVDYYGWVVESNENNNFWSRP